MVYTILFVGIGLKYFHTQTNKSFRDEIISAHCEDIQEVKHQGRKEVYFKGIRLIKDFISSFMRVFQ